MVAAVRETPVSASSVVLLEGGEVVPVPEVQVVGSESFLDVVQQTATRDKRGAGASQLLQTSNQKKRTREGARQAQEQLAQEGARQEQLALEGATRQEQLAQRTQQEIVEGLAQRTQQETVEGQTSSKRDREKRDRRLFQSRVAESAAKKTHHAKNHHVEGLS